MTLGSPSSPSGPTGGNYLPSYLMGEPNTMTAPRTNTLSPTKGRTLAFCMYFLPIISMNLGGFPFSIYLQYFDFFSIDWTFLAASSPTSPMMPSHELNRSVMQQRNLFGGATPCSPPHNYANTAPLLNATPSGPPTQVCLSTCLMFVCFVLMSHTWPFMMFPC